MNRKCRNQFWNMKNFDNLWNFDNLIRILKRVKIIL